MGEISFQESSHGIYVSNQYAGYFIFRKEMTQDGKPKWLITNVSLDPFWRGRGIVTKVARWFVDRARRENALVEISNIGNPLMIAIADKLLSDVYVTVFMGANQLSAMEILGPVTVLYGDEKIGELKIQDGVIAWSHLRKHFQASVEENRVVIVEKILGREWRPLYFKLYSRHHLPALNMGKLFRVVEIVSPAGGTCGRLHFDKDGDLDSRKSYVREEIEAAVEGFKVNIKAPGGGRYHRIGYAGHRFGEGLYPIVFQQHDHQHHR